MHAAGSRNGHGPLSPAKRRGATSGAHADHRPRRRVELSGPRCPTRARRSADRGAFATDDNSRAAASVAATTLADAPSASPSGQVHRLSPRPYVAIDTSRAGSDSELWGVNPKQLVTVVLPDASAQRRRHRRRSCGPRMSWCRRHRRRGAGAPVARADVSATAGQERRAAGAGAARRHKKDRTERPVYDIARPT